MVYGSIPYTYRDGTGKIGCCIECVQNDMLESLKSTLEVVFMCHTCHSRVFSSVIRFLMLLESLMKWFKRIEAAFSLAFCISILKEIKVVSSDPQVLQASTCTCRYMLFILHNRGYTPAPETQPRVRIMELAKILVL